MKKGIKSIAMAIFMAAIVAAAPAYANNNQQQQPHSLTGSVTLQSLTETGSQGVTGYRNFVAAGSSASTVSGAYVMGSGLNISGGTFSVSDGVGYTTNTVLASAGWNTTGGATLTLNSVFGGGRN